jgi:predicted nuclease of predicted toxin-antitoxin system
MLRFIADENFDNDIVRAVHSRNPHIDLVRVQDQGLLHAPDPIILEWAAREDRILLTHDVATVPDYAYERIGADLPMPGVIVVRTTLPLRDAIEGILLIAECSFENEWAGQVVYLPLKGKS